MEKSCDNCYYNVEQRQCPIDDTICGEYGRLHKWKPIVSHIGTLIENLLMEHNIDIEDYTDLTKGISQYAAIEKAILFLIDEYENKNRVDY
jgi:hypothetical protein